MFLLKSSTTPPGGVPETAPHLFPFFGRWLPYGVIGVLMILANCHLLGVAGSEHLAFSADAFHAGAWWQLFTYPFFHISIYHLLIDGLAFFTLLSCFSRNSWLQKTGLFIASALGSVLISLLVDPRIYSFGLCGLSGVCHGMMAVYGLQLLDQSDKSEASSRVIGMSIFLIITLKCTVELLSGSVVFAGMHAGPLGTPITACHAGGVIGGLVYYCWLRLR